MGSFSSTLRLQLLATLILLPVTGALGFQFVLRSLFLRSQLLHFVRNIILADVVEVNILLLDALTAAAIRSMNNDHLHKLFDHGRSQFREVRVVSGTKTASKFLMVCALAAIGLNTSFASMKKAGIRPMIHGFIISALVVIVALLVEMGMGIV